MSIRFKFRSSVNFDTIEIDGRDSISVRELRARILGGKNFVGVREQQQGFDLVFSDALSGQEYKGDDFQIPTGSSVIVKRVPGGTVPLSAVSPIEAVKDFGMKNSYTLNPANESADAFDDFGADICFVPDSNLRQFDFEIDKNNLIGNERKDIDGLRLECQLLNSNVLSQAILRGSNKTGNERNIIQEARAEEQMNLNKLTTSNFLAVQSNNLPLEMKCSLCNTFFKEAVMIPCCQHSFCEKCIRLVLVEKKRCPKCFSSKCNVEDLLPNLSLRQAIEHFLESQMIDTGFENTMQKYVPDGESAIEAKDVSCAVTVVQRGLELPHSSYADRNIKSALPMQKVKQIHGVKGGYSHHDSMQRGPEAFAPLADFQGENQPVVIPEANVHDEADYNTERQGGFWIDSRGSERNFLAHGGYKKWNRNCYTCGSPDHLMRDCPVSSSNLMFHPGNGAFHGGMPGYAPHYWNGSTLPHYRSFANMYNNPAMMPFNTSMVPTVPPYFPSMCGGLSGPGGNMRMGNMGPLNHSEYFGLQHFENRGKHSNENRGREQLSDDEDDGFPEGYWPNGPEKSNDYKLQKVKEPSLSHSGDSFTRRLGRRNQHDKYMDSDIKVDEIHEKSSHSSFIGRDKRLYHAERSNSVNEDVLKSSDRHSGGRHKHHHGESKKYHERKGHGDSDSSLGHHLSEKGVKRRVESDVRGSYKKKHHSHLGSSFEPSSPVDRRWGYKERDAEHYYRDSGRNEKPLTDKERDDRWQTVSGSDKDCRDEYRYRRRKRVL